MTSKERCAKGIRLLKKQILYDIRHNNNIEVYERYDETDVLNCDDIPSASAKLYKNIGLTLHVVSTIPNGR